MIEEDFMQPKSNEILNKQKKKNWGEGGGVRGNNTFALFFSLTFYYFNNIKLFLDKMLFSLECPWCLTFYYYCYYVVE